MLSDVRNLLCVFKILRPGDLHVDQDFTAFEEALKKLKLREISLPLAVTRLEFLGVVGQTQRLKRLSLVLGTRIGDLDLVHAQHRKNFSALNQSVWRV